jgi:hypothetical protein
VEQGPWWLSRFQGDVREEICRRRVILFDSKVTVVLCLSKAVHVPMETVGTCGKETAAHAKTDQFKSVEDICL